MKNKYFKIVEVSRAAWPAMALLLSACGGGPHPGLVLMVMPDGNSFCSGSFISPKAVLSAAHCLQAEGTYTARTLAAEHKSSTKLVASLGEVGDPMDIGLLLFDEPVVASDVRFGFAPAVAVGDEVVLKGYGCTDIEARHGSGIPRSGSNTVSLIENGFIRLLTPRTLAGTYGIIGGSSDAGSCFGDSGGPMLKEADGVLELVGVIHGGGYLPTFYTSEVVNIIGNNDLRDFLLDADAQYDLDLVGLE